LVKLLIRIMKTLIITLATIGIACCVAGIVTVKMLPIGLFQERPPATIHSQHAPKFLDTIHLDRATTYQPTEAQCDSNPLTTADGSRINPDNYQRWVAMSWDIIWDVERQGLYSDTTLWRGKFEFGDTIQIYSKKFPHLNGDWYLHDVMSSEYRMSIDFLLEPEKNYPKLGVGKDVKIIYCGYED